MPQYSDPLVTNLGFQVIAAGASQPVFNVDRYGNGYFAGTVTFAGTVPLVLANNVYLSGNTTAGAAKRLVGVNSSNAMSVDADALGVVFGGTVSGPSSTLSVKGASRQTVRVYGSATNYIYMTHSGLTTADIGTSDDVSLTFSIGGSSQWAIGANALGFALLPLTDNTYDIGLPSFTVRAGYFRATNTKATTVAGLSSLPAVAGTRSFVTDSDAANFTAGIGAIVAAGGSTAVPVVYDGTNWRIG